MSIKGLAAMKAKLDTFLAKAAARSKEKPGSATTSDNTTNLGGKDYSTWFWEIIGRIQAHAARRDNPHGLTAAQVNAYNKPTAMAALATTLPADACPIISYGKQNEYPVDTSGAFEAAFRYQEMRWSVMNVEPDGSVALIRNGTDGGRTGAFLCYSEDASTAAKPTMIYTNNRYKAPYFPAGKTSAYVFQGGAGVIAGKVQNLETGEFGETFISLMDGSIFGSNHRGILISSEWFADYLHRGECILTPDGVYVLTMADLRDAASQKFDMAVHFFPISAFSAAYQALVEPIRITNCTTKDLYGETPRAGTPANIHRLAECVVSRLMTDKPFIHAPGSRDTQRGFVSVNHRPGIFSIYDPASGKVKGSFRGTRRTSISGFSGYLTHRFNFEYEITLTPTSSYFEVKAGAGSLPDNPPVRLIVSDSANTATVAGPAYTLPGGEYYGFGDSDQQASVTVGDDGTVYVFTDGYYQFIPNLFNRGKASAGPNSPKVNGYLPMTCLRTPWVSTDNSYPPAPSALGQFNSSPVPIPSGWLVHSFGRRADGQSTAAHALFSIGTPGFTYKSLYNGSYTGWSPNTRRQFVSDTPGHYQDTTYPASVVATDGTVTTSLGVLGDGIRMSGMMRLAANGTASVPISITTAALENLRAAVVAAMAPNVVRSMALEIITTEMADLPPILNVPVVFDDGSTWTWAWTLNSGRSGAITPTLKDPIGSVRMSGGPSTYNIGPQSISTRSAYFQAYQTADAYLIGLRMVNSHDSSGAAAMFDSRFAMSRSTGKVVDGTYAVIRRSNSAPNLRGVVAIAGMGLCEMIDTNTDADFVTKALIAPAATTVEDMKNWSYDTDRANWRVLASAQMASAWTVAFNQAEPLVLGGRYYELQPVTINLADIKTNPANTTFYVYAVTVPSPSYQVTETKYPDSMQRMYLGSITTNASAVERMSIGKVVGYGGGRLSTVAAGQSIPVSGGLPSRRGSLIWK